MEAIHKIQARLTGYQKTKIANIYQYIQLLENCFYIYYKTHKLTMHKLYMVKETNKKKPKIGGFSF